MKHELLFILLFSFRLISANAQDTIRMHSGEKLVVKVIANKPYTIEYTYPGETSYTSSPKSLISYIAYSSGRFENITDFVNITGIDGWRNVVFTAIPEDVVGLTRTGEVMTKIGKAGNPISATGLDAEASEKLQREAAIMGAHIILMAQSANGKDKVEPGKPRFANGKAYGIAYRYPFKDVLKNMPYTGDLARKYYGAPPEPDNKNPVGRKVLFEYHGEIFEGEITKQYGKFFKIKFTDKQGKEISVDKHMDKVEFGKK
ncbi:hypothetical protein [Spirosoma sp. KNUC1025]|uniref:hypothetical protein n=1 Tax=Spirosoma sp. KNUC1025 TaxID=2894082 RepID=UPI00386933FB|nr:hypothetical protein LN737_23645 [Spirosoma sp. KNUC1025]